MAKALLLVNPTELEIFQQHLVAKALLLVSGLSYRTGNILPRTMKELDTVESLSAGAMWDPNFLPRTLKGLDTVESLSAGARGSIFSLL